MTSFELQKTSHPLYHTKPQPLLLHIHFRHDITHPVSYIAPTVSLSSHLSTDVTPTFVWHHTHYMCDIICTIYNIICTAFVITILYLGQHKLDIWNHIHYAVQNIHYPSDITVTSLCHHTHSIKSITHTLCMTSHLAYVYHLLHYRRHYILTLWNQATIFMTSHTLYLTSYQHCFFHHIHCIDDIIPTLFMRSHPLYMSTSYPLYCIQEPIHYVCTITATVPVSHPHFPWYHTLCIYDIAPTICLTSDTLYKVSYPQFVSSRHIIYDITGVLFMSSLPQYITLHPQYLCPHNPSTYDLWTTVCMTSHPLYIWHLMHHT